MAARRPSAEADPQGTRDRPVWPPVPGLPTLSAGDRVHLVGVGGAGMSGLAAVLVDLGLIVSGSDRDESPALARLAAAGVEIHVGHRPDALPAGTALVVRSPAVPDDNAELGAARAAGIPVTKRAVLLGALLDARLGVAVAGTHGKTTTAGLLAVVLDEAGLDPTFFVGGDILDLGANARAGTGPHLVVEADEYDRSFLHGHPHIAVVLNVEHDHPDIYPTLDDVVAAFRAFVEGVRPDGRVIALAGSPTVRAVVETAHVPVERYGLAGEVAPDEPRPLDWEADAVAVAGETQRFEVRHRGEPVGTFAIRLPGRHNVANALAVIAAATALGVPSEAVRRALARYRGTARRFERLGRVGGVEVVDDYAHHPTEIRATIQAARDRGAGRVWAIAQPHTYSRVAALADAFASALATADRAVLTPVYAAREQPLAGVDASGIAARMPSAVVAADLDDAARIAADGAVDGDSLLFLGAGDVTLASRQCLGRLARRQAAAVRDAARAQGLGLGGETRTDAVLGPHTSFKTGGPAALLVRASAIDDLVAWLRLATEHGLPARVLGRGSNVLVDDAGFPGLVVVNRCERWELREESAGHAAVLEAESGVSLPALVHVLARKGWAGLEAAAGIPGSIGAGVVTNAGAHGWAMGDSVAWVEVFEADGAIRRRDPAHLAFAYRTSVLKGDARRTVLRVALRLVRDEPAAILARVDAHIALRRATQPTTPSAGSMFKNPTGDYAGRLIEAAGLKGVVAGGAMISPVHANFFVNVGGATTADVLQLVEIARAAVHRAFCVRLELEIETLGARDAVA